MAYKNNTKVGPGVANPMMANTIPTSPAKRGPVLKQGENIDRKNPARTSKAPIDPKKMGMA